MRAIKPDTFPKTQRNPLYDTLIIAKSVKYSAIQKESIETVRESKLFFFALRFPPQFFLFPPPQFYYFPSSIFFFFYSLLHNFIILPRLLIHLLISLYIFPSRNTSTSYRPYIDPTSTLDSTFFQHNFVNSESIYHHHHISLLSPPPPPPSHFYCFPPPPPHFYCFPPPPALHFHCFPSTTTTTTFLLFSLLLLFSYETGQKGQPQAKIRPKRSNSNNLSSRKTIGGVKRIEMWWWWENNRNVVVVVEGKQWKCGGGGIQFTI